MEDFDIDEDQKVDNDLESTKYRVSSSTDMTRDNTLNCIGLLYLSLFTYAKE